MALPISCQYRANIGANISPIPPIDIGTATPPADGHIAPSAPPYGGPLWPSASACNFPSVASSTVRSWRYDVVDVGAGAKGNDRGEVFNF
jgi:hypothetical protein